jgi:hypothetical protein
MANTALRVTELDFDGIRNNLKDFLRSQPEFTDYDFEGSGMAVLLDILAYNTHYMGYYLNMVANESFLDTAQLRNSILSHAKVMNYVPASNRGAETKVNIVATPTLSEDNDVTTIVLDKYTRFLGRDIDGRHHAFVTVNANTAAKVNGSFSFANVEIKQGEVITLQYLMTPDNSTRRFKIPSANVDVDTLTVTVQESTTNTDINVYTRGEDITLVDANSASYFIEEDADGSYMIQFGDGVIGKKPKDGSVIIATYLDSLGDAANKISHFSAIDPIGGYFSSNVTVTATAATYGGTMRESIEDVRYRAPRFYTTQNRAVTKHDYETLITMDYPFIEGVSVWGGEDNDPPVYGKVYMSLKTVDNYFLTNLEKEDIKQSLIRNRNIITIIPEIIDPDYTYVLIRGTVYFNPSLTTRTAAEINTLIRAAIDDYRTDELLGFDTTFRKSLLQNYIENADKAITGSDIELYLQKRILIEPEFNKTYNATTDFPVKKGDFNSQLYTLPQLNVYDTGGTLRQVYFEEVPAAFTGVDSIDIINPGINYTSDPTVTIIGDGTGATATAKVLGNKVVEITVTNKGSNYSRATVSITGGGGSQATAVTKLEAKFGTLRSYYYKTNGEKVIINSNAGTINYETGAIQIASAITTGTVTNSFYDTNILTVNIPIEREVIPAFRNRIIDIDENDALSIQIDVVAET